MVLLQREELHIVIPLLLCDFLGGLNDYDKQNKESNPN
jgi:hypothetical protein